LFVFYFSFYSYILSKTPRILVVTFFEVKDFDENWRLPYRTV